MERKELLRLVSTICLVLNEQVSGGMPNGHLYAFLQADPINVTLDHYQVALAVASTAGLITNTNHWLALTEKGRGIVRELDTMSKKTATAEKTSKKTPEELQEALVETIAKFPTSFKVEGHKGSCQIAPSKCSIDPETGEETLAVLDKKGELVGEFTAKDLKGKITEEAGGKGSKKGGKAKKSGGSGKETHVDRMRRLLLAGATSDEIFSEFKKVFSAEPRRGDHKNDSSDEAIRRRIYLYTWRTADRFEDVKKILESRRAERKAKAPKKEKASGKKTSSKKGGKEGKKKAKKASD